MKQTEHVLLRGTERYHMENYLVMRGYQQENNDTFTAPGIRAVFDAPRKIQLGALLLTEVEVLFDGDGEKVIAETAALRSRFMTAGG